MNKFVLAIDQGTTGTTAILFDKTAKTLGRGYAEIPQIYPQPGWVEHDPRKILASVKRAVDAAIASVKAKDFEISAVGITNQRETTVLWDKTTGEPIHNAIVWQCRRTAGECERLVREGHADKFASRTGLPVDAYFSGTKIAWLLDNVRGARVRAERGDLLFGTIDTWLLWNISKERSHRTEHTNASRTLAYNIHERAWDSELLRILGIPERVLPEVLNSRADFGTTRKFGKLPAGIPITGIAGDQQAALAGQAGFASGSIKNTYGTGCFLLMNTGESYKAPKSGLLATICVGNGGKPAYALEGSVFVAGAAIQWLRDGLCVIANASETEKLAMSVEDTAGVTMVPAFTGLGAPYWDMHARGAILGLTRGVARAHIVRAALEAIALQTADVIDAMRFESGKKLRALRVDGGASANNFLAQFQADVLGVKIQRPKNLETTAAGAAFLAGLHTGFWKDEKEIEKLWKVDREFKPKMNAKARAEKLAEWKSAVAKVLTNKYST
ncbi:MAG: glycerol kinase GlpK [Planctomycetes bacterium]|nr:glycerol kinase GlpK [Planctomycetota bacterium]